MRVKSSHAGVFSRTRAGYAKPYINFTSPKKEENEDKLIKTNKQDSLDSELLNDDDSDIDFRSLNDEFDMNIFVC